MTVVNCPRISIHAPRVFFLSSPSNWTATHYAEGERNIMAFEIGPAYTYVIGEDGFISRCAAEFDTSGVPTTSAISKVVLKGQIKFSTTTGGGSPVDTYVNLCRLSPPDLSGSDDDDLWAVYIAVRDANINYGYVMIPPTISEWTNFEVTLNDYAIAAINKGGSTWIAFKLMVDVPTPPDNGTRGGITHRYLSLDVTYGTVPGALQVVTLPATEITKTTATLNGEIIAGSACKRGFDWGEDDAMDNEWYEEGTFGISKFSHGITGLTEDARYCFRAKGEETPL